MTIATAAEIDDVRAVEALLRASLADPETGWSVGSFGAIAEFIRDADETVTELTDGRLGAYTSRGAIAFTPIPGLRPVAYETAINSGWNHAIALCLPEEACAMTRRTVVTELGPDKDAARDEDRDAILFDLGLDLLAIDACVRSADPETIACLRSGVGKPVFDHANPIGPRLVAMSPNRVFVGRAGRAEVFQPIPPADGKSPEGPHTHVMPKLLKSGRTHAATTPIPEGFVPFAAIHPAHPYKDALGQRIPFLQERVDAFQALLDRWGNADLVAAKRHVTEGGNPDEVGAGRHIQAARRVAENQARYRRGEIMEIAPDEAEPEVE
ncbi:DUF6925 family protein [Methylobacterium brachythecii]|uniref:Uncharacterized protein n=1 Tax=Methylobacterium brachythecii TaxID=1176177 RepID=A0A7W6F6B1_9HYPH|nr:hypothetical protein [Methylobacterium brachythecii]MBB3902212.1 hypothetical protein [Methylobacterium brachythecii]GLS42058.1 hypothetical protein GCM10007884_00430 [Methylobacterium brachythecii]